MENLTECPKCFMPSTLYFNSLFIHKTYDHGPVYYCGCDSDDPVYVGCHDGSHIPLGTLAGRYLRKLRQRCHAVFDPIWQSTLPKFIEESTIDLHKPGESREFTQTPRQIAYNVVAQRMAIKSDVCHIGHFNIAQCRVLLRICREKIIENTVLFNLEQARKRHNASLIYRCAELTNHPGPSLVRRKQARANRKKR